MYNLRIIFIILFSFIQAQYIADDFISIYNQNLPFSVCNGTDNYADGDSWNMADYNGDLNGGNYKVLMLDIVATWWAPCQQTIVNGHADEIHQYWTNNNHVEIITILDDIGCPTSCSGWAGLYQESEPLIIDDGDDDCSSMGGTIFHWFENPTEIETGSSGFPIYVFINHKMQIHKIKYSVPPDVAILYIQQMIDKMDLELSNNYDLHVPYNFAVTNIYPNPFNPVLNINFDIAWSGITKVNILDIYGSHIETLHSGFLHSGRHELSWHAESMPSGLYLVSLQAGENSLTKKVVLLK